MNNDNPHAAQPLIFAGTPLAKATSALLLLHGRGASAEDILGLGEAIAPAGVALAAPQAAGHTWYPYSFLAPRRENEPYLTSALARIQVAIAEFEAAGIPADGIALCGFSQGACLATEFVARHPRRYAALVAFTGGLIGPPGAPLSVDGPLGGLPVLFSSGDPDPHVPWARVEQSAELLREAGAEVTMRRYPGRPHTVLHEEAETARTLLASLGSAA
ncbi:MAG: dienelactone hydrolase family protein [Terracidiphilus sp.]|nr:dienelactone hydrolase family protein [Terracidiphilus sp.]